MNLNVFYILLALALGACAHTPVPVSFTAPSTAPIQKAIAAVHQEHKTAQAQVQTTAKDLDQILDACPQAKAIIAQAQFALSQASDALASAEADTATAEGARTQLDTQLKQTTDKANALASNYANSQVQITGLKASRHRWVKYFWITSALLVGAGIWIFKRPLMLMAGGVI